MMLKRFLLAALSATMLVACGEDEAPPPVAPTAAKKKVVEAAPVAAVTQVDYVYAPLNKLDPFRSPIEMQPSGDKTVPGPAEPDCTDPLCLADLDEFRVVAVISGDANPMAMVEDRGGVGHIVRRNTRIGKQGGKVIQILRDCIVVLSFVSGGADGKPQPNKQNLCVQTEATGGAPLDLFKNKEFVP
jgi:type IV pilus assembly protein PilP